MEEEDKIVSNTNTGLTTTACRNEASSSITKELRVDGLSEMLASSEATSGWQLSRGSANSSRASEMFRSKAAAHRKTHYRI